MCGQHRVASSVNPYRSRGAIDVLTSGSTGTPLRVRITLKARQFQWAVWWRHKGRFGFELGDKFLTFGARLPITDAILRPPYWRYNRAINQIYLSTYHLTPETMPVVVDWLNREEFAFYTGYPSAMYVLANFIREQSLSFTKPPQMVVSGSDALLPGFERVVGEVFGAPVTDQYGMAEACGNFARCENGKYHLDFEFGAVEALPLEGQTNSRLRRLVFTGFANPAMPFIRYDIGDYGWLSEEPCTCGRHTLTLDAIEGRTEDFVRTPDGRMAIGMNQVFEWAPGILEAQVRQDAIDEIEVLLVPAASYNKRDEEVLTAEFRKRLGSDIAIRYRLVDHIPRTQSGKFRAVVSTIATGNEVEQEHRHAVSSGLSI